METSPGELSYFSEQEGLHGFTNDLGEYRVAGLHPGDWVISATANVTPIIGRNQPPVDRGGGSWDYLSVFFPGVPSIEEAQALTFGAGQVMNGLDFRLARSRVFRISGSFQSSEPLSGELTVSLVQSGKGLLGLVQARLEGVVRLDPEKRTFSFREVRPGTYDLFVGDAAGKRGVVGWAQVAVSGDDVDGLVVPELGPAGMSGRVRVEGKAVEEGRIHLGQLSLSLTAYSSRSFMGIQQVGLGNDGRFELNGISAGPKLLAVTGMSVPTYIKTFTVAGKEIRELYLVGDLSNLELVLSTDVASLTGKVEGEESGGMAVLEAIKAAQTFRGDSGRQAIRVEAGGQFRFQGLGPGEYRVYSFEALEEGMEQSPDFLRRFWSRAATVKVGEGESGTVTLKQIGKAEVEEAMKQ